MGQLSIIDPQKGLFSKIECRDYDILVPFICSRTGNCCSVYVPRIPFDGLEVLARYINRQADEFIAAYQFSYGQKLKGRTVRCPFLDGDNHCQIYNHVLRPEVCRLFPFSYGGGVIQSCSAHVAHCRFLDILLKGEETATVYDSSFCPNLELRPIPEVRWKGILTSLQSMPLNRDVYDAFVDFNRL